MKKKVDFYFPTHNVVVTYIVGDVCEYGTVVEIFESSNPMAVRITTDQQSVLFVGIPFVCSDVKS